VEKPRLIKRSENLAEKPIAPYEESSTGSFRRILLERVTSTMDVARQAARQGAAEGLVIQAREQTAGRGRLGRSWSSPPGNLHATLLLRPTAALSLWPQLSLLAAVALAETLEALGVRGLQLKWPNDLLVEGAKLAGLLLESESATPPFLLLGLGVNLRHHPPDLPYPATSLARELPDALPATEALLGSFLALFASWRRRWEREGFAPLRESWLARAYRRGQKVCLQEGRGLRSGLFLDLDLEGRLVLRREDGGVLRVAAGELLAPGQG